MLSMAASRLLRSTGTNEAMRIALPRIGMRNNSFFTKTDVRPGSAGITTGGSTLETWLHMKIKFCRGSSCSRPWVTTFIPARRNAIRADHGQTIHHIGIAGDERPGKADDG